MIFTQAIHRFILVAVYFRKHDFFGCHHLAASLTLVPEGNYIKRFIYLPMQVRWEAIVKIILFHRYQRNGTRYGICYLYLLIKIFMEENIPFFLLKKLIVDIDDKK